MQGMGKSRDRIPDEVLEEIFPKKLNRRRVSETVYTELKQMILSGQLENGRRLVREEIAQHFNVSEMAVTRAFRQLKKDRLVISKGRVGSFVKDNEDCSNVDQKKSSPSSKWIWTHKPFIRKGFP